MTAQVLLSRWLGSFWDCDWFFPCFPAADPAVTTQQHGSALVCFFLLICSSESESSAVHDNLDALKMGGAK